MGSNARAIIIIALLLAVPTLAAPAPTVSLSMADVPMPEAMAAISQQAGAQIEVIQEPDSSVTVDLEDTDVETAVHETAMQAGCSWVRLYVIYSGQHCELEAAGIRKAVALARKDRNALMSEEKKKAMADAVQKRITTDTQGAPEQTPLGGHVRSPGASDVFSRLSTDDPIIRLMSAYYSDPATLSCQDVALSEALTRVGLTSGFFVLYFGEKPSEQITVDLQQVPVDDIVAAIADQIGCRWSRLYVVGHAQKLSDQELEQRMDGLFNSGMNRFWSEPPEKRQEIIDRIVTRTSQLTPEQRGHIRSSKIAKKMMTKFMNYTMQLPANKRQELMPLMQQAARIMQ